MASHFTTTDNQNCWRRIALAPGEQAVVNGALVMAEGECLLLVGQSASVLTGAVAGRSGSARCVADELYYATLERRAFGHQGRGGNETSSEGLFDLLGRAVAVMRTSAAQRLCARYAAALVVSDMEEALAIARNLAEEASSQSSRPTPPLRSWTIARQSTGGVAR